VWQTRQSSKRQQQGRGLSEQHGRLLTSVVREIGSLNQELGMRLFADGLARLTEGLRIERAPSQAGESAVDSMTPPTYISLSGPEMFRLETRVLHKERIKDQERE